MRFERTGYVYIMASKSGTLYIGVTSNIERRVYEHKLGRSKCFTKKYDCKKLVYFAEIELIVEAISHEKKLKGWSRKKKEALIKSQNPTWKGLAEDWYRPENFADPCHPAEY